MFLHKINLLDKYLKMTMANYDEIDLTLAIQLQEQFQEELKSEQRKEEVKILALKKTGYKWNPKWKDLPEPEQEKLAVSLVDSCWELLDPNPNIFDLFLTFNHQFFWGRLLGVEVKWSPRMTLCAGVCSYEGRGGLCSIRLSTPLLKLRPRKDLVETLLHEMIHAYLFVTHNNTDHDGHGPQFHKHMKRINKLAHTNITVYHSFHDEVNTYRQHIWKCDGPCRKRPPYFGLVKRSMNRAPAPTDFWWGEHSRTCGGRYTKIQEPEGYQSKKNGSKRKVEVTPDNKAKDIRSYFPAANEKKVKTMGDFPSGKENGRTSSSGNSVKKKDSSSKYPKNNGMQNKTGVTNNNAGGNIKRPKITSAVASSFGSKTIVVPKRKVSSPKKEAKPPIPVFSGTGHTLGASTSHEHGQSRLLSMFQVNQRAEGSTNVRKKEVENGKSNLGKISKPTTETVTCPNCQIILDSDLKKHLETCIDSSWFDDDTSLENWPNSSNPAQSESNSGLSISKSTSTASQSSKSESNTKVNSEVIIIDDNGLVNNPDASSKAKVQIYFPCPICEETFHEDEINWHTNSHFA